MMFNSVVHRTVTVPAKSDS